MTEEEFLKELGAEVDTRRLSDTKEEKPYGNYKQVAGHNEGQQQ